LTHCNDVVPCEIHNGGAAAKLIPKYWTAHSPLRTPQCQVSKTQSRPKPLVVLGSKCLSHKYSVPPVVRRRWFDPRITHHARRRRRQNRPSHLPCSPPLPHSLTLSPAVLAGMRQTRGGQPQPRKQESQPHTYDRATVPLSLRAVLSSHAVGRRAVWRRCVS
jgi:hypothetical protein